MGWRLLLLVSFLQLFVSGSWAQDAQALKFRLPSSASVLSANSNAKSTNPANTAATALARSPAQLAKVTKGTDFLPNSHGQQWREYDIKPYTSRVTSTERAEQAIVDWILVETGTDVWFSEPLGLLTASRDRLIVYHTPEMQRRVGEIVDRFVSSQAESHAFSLQLVTIGSPNWRNRALPLMQSVTVQAPGVDAWLLSKENAAILLGELRKRGDFRQHNSPDLVIHNGQSQTITRTRPRNYVRSLQQRNTTASSYELMMGQIQEGFSLQISPLLTMEKDKVDAVIKCHIDQVEKLVPVPVDIPTAFSQRQSTQIQVPQLVSWRLHERFQWPTDRVLLLSCGVVATPSNERSGAFVLPNLLSNPRRADALLFVESKGKASQTLNPQRTAERGSSNNRGRY